MYRKRSGSSYSKRRTNIYDPQGVYKKGLTKKQKTGMSKQVKLQYLEMPKPRITRQLLDEYKKTLQFYGIKTIADIKNYVLEFPMKRLENQETDLIYLSVETIGQKLRSLGVEFVSFTVSMFSVEASADFPYNFSYTQHLGEGYFTEQASVTSSTSSSNRQMFFIHPLSKQYGLGLVYDQIEFDSQRDDAFVNIQTGDPTNLGAPYTSLPYTSEIPMCQYPPFVIPGVGPIDTYVGILYEGGGDYTTGKIRVYVSVV